MKYLLDTCTVSDFVKGESGVTARIKSMPPSQFAVSTVTRMEIAYGLALNPTRARALAPMLEAFLSVIASLSLDDADAQAAASIRAALKSRGQPIGAYDLLIAGTGLARGLVLVTANVGEFERVGGLQVENWRQGA